jgi:hypothetical protein
VNLLGDDTYTINKNTEMLIDASKEDGLLVNVKKTKYMLVVHYLTEHQNGDIKIANRLFSNVS